MMLNAIDSSLHAEPAREARRPGGTLGALGALGALGLAGLALLNGCAVPESDPEETGEVEQHGRCDVDPDGWECNALCGGCGHNGFREGSWNLLFGQFNRLTLKDYGMWVDADGGRSLCNPSQTFSDHCVMRNGYSAWIADNTYSRTDIMTHLVAGIAQTGYWVKDPAPNGNTYWGSFGLRPQALTQSWDYRTQETITALLLAQLNAVQGVAICLLNEQTPTNCSSTAGKFEESSTYGNHFQYYYAGISGGKDAPDPELNQRFGKIPQVDPNGNDPLAYPFDYAPGVQCDYTGSGGNRHATRCMGAPGVWWQYPVTVRMPADPDTWFYPPGSGSRPASWPQVPIDN